MNLPIFDFRISGDPNPQCITKWDKSCTWWSTPSSPFLNIFSPVPFTLSTLSFLSYADQVPPNSIRIYGLTNSEDLQEIYFINDSFCREFLYLDSADNYKCYPNISKTYEINSKIPFTSYQIRMESNTCVHSSNCCFTCFLLAGIKIIGKFWTEIPNCNTNSYMLNAFRYMFMLSTYTHSY